MSNKIDRSYVSEIDQFLHQFDQKHSKLSLSQQKEKTKYEKVYRKRDKTDQPDDKTLPEWF